MPKKDIIELRKRILNCTDGSPRTAAQISELLRRGGLAVSPASVGNNLRYLTQGNYVKMVKSKWGARTWIRGDEADNYTEDESVAVLFVIPLKVSIELDRVAQMLHTTRTQVAVDALAEHLGVFLD